MKVSGYQLKLEAARDGELWMDISAAILEPPPGVTTADLVVPYGNLMDTIMATRNKKLAQREVLQVPPQRIAMVGWKCPNCGAGVSPYCTHCPHCAPPLRITC